MLMTLTAYPCEAFLQAQREHPDEAAWRDAA